MGRRTVLTVVTIACAALATTVAAQHQHHGAPAPSAPAVAKPAPPAAGSRRVTMDDLHRGGGVPRGWKFTLPAGGDAARGKQLFADLECYKCHRVDGAGFPPTGGDGKVGPPLTGVGSHHPAEYFAESILSPNAIIVEGAGFLGPDGRSIMPSFADALSVTQLVDLVAYLKSQAGGGHHHGASQERTAGPYRVRLVFEPAKDGGHAGHGHHAPAKPGAAGHLMAFVTDAATGETMPYLPVSAAVHAQGAPARMLKLAPMLSADGFHYGAHATLPVGTQRIVLSIGAPTIPMTGADPAPYARPHTTTFDWSASSR